MKLMPCPKCGSNRVQYMQCTGAIRCKQCQYKLPAQKNEQETVRVWNEISRENEKG